MGHRNDLSGESDKRHLFLVVAICTSVQLPGQRWGRKPGEESGPSGREEHSAPMGGRWGMRACLPAVGLQQQGLISYRGRNPREGSGQVGNQEACAKPVT